MAEPGLARDELREQFPLRDIGPVEPSRSSGEPKSAPKRVAANQAERQTKRAPTYRRSPSSVGYAASDLRDWRRRLCGSRWRLRRRMTLGVTSTSSSSWM